MELAAELLLQLVVEVRDTVVCRQVQRLLQVVRIAASGGAQPVALAIDGEDWPEVVGTIAGDDTVLIICPDNKRANLLRDRLEAMIG